jgi:tetratricopeptide (TPR) repeat protein
MLSSLLKRLVRGPTAAEALHRGKTAYEEGRLQEAARLLDAAALAHSGDSECAAYAGLAHYGLGDYRSALEHFESAVALAPERSNYRFNAAAASWALGDRKAARARCAEALERDPCDVPTLSLLARITLPGPTYTELLAMLHRTLSPRTYLEIGVAQGVSLKLAQASTRVVGIDPAPQLQQIPGANTTVHTVMSDDYFSTRDVRADFGGLPIDMAFIDGAHLFEQALKDFINVERHATPQSVILLHDTYPLTRLTAERDRRSEFWSGDVWRLVLVLKKYRPDLSFSNVGASPTGLGVVRALDPGSHVLQRNLDAIIDEFMAVDYSVLDADKPATLGLTPNDSEAVLRLVGGFPTAAARAAAE